MIETTGHIMSDDMKETEVEKRQRRLKNAKPPSFYEADIEKYYKKFDSSLKQRSDFKLRMKEKMIFKDIQWNSNIVAADSLPAVEQGSEGDGQTESVGHARHRRNKQVFKVAKGKAY